MSNTQESTNFGYTGGGAYSYSSTNKKEKICDINKRDCEIATHSSASNHHLFDDDETSFAIVLSDSEKEAGNSTIQRLGKEQRLFGQSRASLDLFDSFGNKSLIAGEPSNKDKGSSNTFRSELNIEVLTPSFHESNLSDTRQTPRQATLSKIPNIKHKTSDVHSNLIDFNTPPSSPYKLKNGSSDSRQMQTFHYPTTDREEKLAEQQSMYQQTYLGKLFRI